MCGFVFRSRIALSGSPGARPVKWNGPSLSATDTKVAVESLEIEHEGFLFPVSAQV